MTGVDDVDSKPTKEVVAAISSGLKITKSQAVFVAEALMLAALCRLLGVTDPRAILDLEDATESTEFKKLRLDIKRRLLAETPELKAYSQDRRHKSLDELFDHQLRRILNISGNFAR